MPRVTERSSPVKKISALWIGVTIFAAAAGLTLGQTGSDPEKGARILKQTDVNVSYRVQVPGKPFDMGSPHRTAEVAHAR